MRGAEGDGSSERGVRLTTVGYWDSYPRHKQTLFTTSGSGSLVCSPEKEEKG